MFWLQLATLSQFASSGLVLVDTVNLDSLHTLSFLLVSCPTFRPSALTPRLLISLLFARALFVSFLWRRGEVASVFDFGLKMIAFGLGFGLLCRKLLVSKFGGSRTQIRRNQVLEMDLGRQDLKMNLNRRVAVCNVH